MKPSAGPALLTLLVVLFGSAHPAPAAAADPEPLPGTPAAKALAAGHRAKGEAAAAAGRFGEAERELSQTLSLDPTDAVAKRELAKALFDLASASRKAQQFAQAADAFQRYTSLRPDEPAGYFGLADALRQSGKPLEALSAYSTYVQKEDRASEQASVARARERIAELQKAVRGGAAPAVGAPGVAAPAVGAPALAAPGAGARRPTEGAADAGAGPGSADGGAATAGGATSAAGAQAGAAPGGAEAAASKLIDGDLAFATKDYRTALFAYQDAIVAQPTNARARLKAGQAYARLGYDEEAIGQWNHVLQLEPYNGEVHELIAQAEARNAERARHQLFAGDAGAGTAGAAGAVAGAAAASGRAAAPGTASTARGPAASAPPAPQSAAMVEARKHYAAGVALVRGAAGAAGDQRVKKYQDAIAELDLALAARPTYAVALVARGSAHLGLGQLQDAARDYAAAHDADPGLAAPLFGLAEAYRNQGEAAKAAQLYREFARSTAPDAEAGLKSYALKTAQTLAPR